MVYMQSHPKAVYREAIKTKFITFLLIIGVSALWLIINVPFWAFMAACAAIGIGLGIYNSINRDRINDSSINAQASFSQEPDTAKATSKLFQISNRKLVRKAYLNSLSGPEFEQEVRDMLEMDGYIAELTKPGTPDIDIKAKLVDKTTGEIQKRIVVQCKRYSDNVGLEKVVDFYAAVQRDGADEGFFFTTSAFSLPAIKYARDKGNIVLIDKDALRDVVESQKEL